MNDALFEVTVYPFTLPKVPGHQSVFMNEPRLSDFKQVLLREGIQAEFVGGVLVCNNQVAVRRVSSFLIRTELNACGRYSVGLNSFLIDNVTKLKTSNL